MAITRTRFWRDDAGYLAIWKDPDDTEVVTLDWSERLGGDETIATSEWSAEGITVSSGSISGQMTTATIAGRASRYGSATNKITTSAGRTLSRTLRVYELEA